MLLSFQNVINVNSQPNFPFHRYYDTPTQLDAGVRLVTAQVHKSDSEWRLCHTSCDLLDAGLLSDWLGDIKSWLDDNPNEGAQTNIVCVDLRQANEGCCLFSGHNPAGQLGQCNRIRTQYAIRDRQYHRLRLRA